MNTTTLIQPCDKRIIRTLKLLLSQNEVKNFDSMQEIQSTNVNELDKKTILLDTIHFLAMFWNLVTEDTTQN